MKRSRLPSRPPQTVIPKRKAYDPLKEGEVRAYTIETMPKELAEDIAKAKWGEISGENSDLGPFGVWRKIIPGLDEEVRRYLAGKKKKD